MRFRLRELCLGTLVWATLFCGRTAWAQAALDDDKSATPPTSGAPPATDTSGAAHKSDVEYGIGFRLRNVRIPRGEIELFVEKAGDSGISNVGFGLDLTRRRNNIELQLGIEYEHVNPSEGVYIESNKNVANGDEADFVLSPDHSNHQLGWLTFEFTFLGHAKIANNLFVRYGAGGGLGIVLGELRHYDVVCVGATNEMAEPGCVPNVAPFTGNGQPGDGKATFEIVKYKLPPVFPVLNGIIGLQFRPMPKLTVNVEGGLRTFLFFGVSSSYFF
jgi:hypothetical protein